MSEKSEQKNETSPNETVEETTQNTPAPTEEKPKKPDETSQQTARAIKAEEKLKEATERLKAFEDAEEQKKTSEMEQKGEYEKLMQYLESKRVSYEEQIGNLGTYKEKYEALEIRMETEALALIPEDQRELVTDIVSAYKGEEKLEKIKKLSESFGGNKSFGGTPDARKSKSLSELQDLEDKLSKRTINTSEMNRLKELRVKK